MKVKKKGCSRQGEQNVQSSHGERDRKHLETERTVWLGLKLGKEWRETDRGQGGAVHAGL